MRLLRQAICGHIWKRIVEKSKINATSVTLHPLRQAIWGPIWKHTVEKSQTNAIYVTLHLLWKAIWGDIWNHTVEKNQTNVTNVTLLYPGQTIWGHIWKPMVETSQTNVSVNMNPPRQAIWGLMYALWRKVKQMQPVRLCILSSNSFKEVLGNTQCRKVEQMKLYKIAL